MFRSPREQTHLFQIVFSKGNVTPESYPMSREFLYAQTRSRDAVTPGARDLSDRVIPSQGDAGYLSRRDRLAAELREAGAAGQPFGLRKDTSNLFRDPDRTARRRLDLRGFNHVIAIDADRGWVEAEGMTTYEDLVAATLAHGASARGGAGAQDDHAGRRRRRRGHRGIVVPIRARPRNVARIRCADGDGAGADMPSGQRARRPLLRISELLRHAGLRAQAEEQSRRREALRAARASAVQRQGALLRGARARMPRRRRFHRRRRIRSRRSSI